MTCFRECERFGTSEQQVLARLPHLRSQASIRFGELILGQLRKLSEGIMALQDFVEEVQVLGRDLVDKVKSLVHEGNVRRIIVRDEHGNTFVEIPVTVAAVADSFSTGFGRRRRDFGIGVGNSPLWWCGPKEKPPSA